MDVTIDSFRKLWRDPITRHLTYRLAAVALWVPVCRAQRSPVRGFCQALELASMRLAYGRWELCNAARTGIDWWQVLRDEFPELLEAAISRGGDPRCREFSSWLWPATVTNDRELRRECLDELAETYEKLWVLTQFNEDNFL